MTVISRDILTSTIRGLPSLPAVVMELIDSLGRDDLSAEQLADKLSHDQVLTAKTLRLANSSFYGVPRKVASISEAVSILGMRTVRTVVTAAALTGSFKKDNRTSLDFDALWRHSIATALCAKGLAEALDLDGESAFTLGLLHDIGRLVLATSFAEPYQKALDYQREHDCLPQEAELATIGLDHTVVGGCITEHWRFAPAMVEAVTSHHSPGASSSDVTLAGLVHVADNIAHALGLSRLQDDIVPALNPHVWSAMKLSPGQCDQIFTQAQAQFDGLCQALLMSGTS
ncbi:MAG: HDOD domain-containing protein [Rubrivivax sp.]|nr:MAG: HDOD domain-containing protein [Rubrivivax sp.]